MSDRKIIPAHIKEPACPCNGCEVQEPCERCYSMKRYSQDMEYFKELQKDNPLGLWTYSTMPHCSYARLY